jgi:hypothetical protein
MEWKEGKEGRNGMDGRPNGPTDPLIPLEIVDDGTDDRHHQTNQDQHRDHFLIKVNLCGATDYYALSKRARGNAPFDCMFIVCHPTDCSQIKNRQQDRHIITKATTTVIIITVITGTSASKRSWYFVSTSKVIRTFNSMPSSAPWILRLQSPTPIICKCEFRKTLASTQRKPETGTGSFNSSAAYRFGPSPLPITLAKDHRSALQ